MLAAYPSRILTRLDVGLRTDSDITCTAQCLAGSISQSTEGNCRRAMVWRQAIAALLNSGKVISMAGGLTGTGVYVSYTDWTRYRRMMSKYSSGNILPPMAENSYETVYFQRPQLEQVGLLRTVIHVLTKIIDAGLNAFAYKLQSFEQHNITTYITWTALTLLCITISFTNFNRVLITFDISKIAQKVRDIFVKFSEGVDLEI